jgi:hypothetical protein
MQIRTILVAAILAVLPGLSFATCMGASHGDQAAITCAEGTQWDAETATCIPVSSS